MKLKIGICDDEKNFCNNLEMYILKFAKDYSYDFEVDVWNDSVSFCSDIIKFNPDIIFLDIEIPSYNGIYVGNFIRESLHKSNIEIIFVSHKTSYAMDLFKLHPYDFLVKPVTPQHVYSLLSELCNLMSISDNSYVFSYKNNIFRIPQREIIYIYSRNRYVNICTSEETYCYIGKLKDSWNQISKKRFCSISKSFIVNMHCIKVTRPSEVTMINGDVLTISRSCRDTFRKTFAVFNWGE